MSFVERFDVAVERTGSLLCVGLDPDGFADAGSAERECIEVIEATREVACAYKANLAFFEQHGAAGYAVLERLRARIPESSLYILDAKRADIGNTARAYARALYDVLGADAVTVNPLLGVDSVEPFLAEPSRGVFLLTRTSNPGATDLLEERLTSGRRVFEAIVALGLAWDPGGQVGFVVGATAPDAVSSVRAMAPESPLLLPGAGAQGGSVAEALRAALAEGTGRALVASSRSIATAPDGPAAAATRLRAEIDAVRRRAAAPA